jgi:serine/threonine protein kinase
MDGFRLNIEALSATSYRRQTQPTEKRRGPRLEPSTLPQPQTQTYHFANRYSIVKEISRTQMSVVRLAFDWVKRTGAIIKYGICHLGAEPILREAFFLSQNIDPSFPQLYDIGVHQDEGYVYISMEQIHGQDLNALIYGGEPQPLYRSIERAMMVAGALNNLHSAGYVHLDLKPENVMEEDSGRIRLIDFGLADNIGTSYQCVIGTPLYVSPEMARLQPVDQRADMYALGLMLYESITRNNPMDAPDINQIFINQMSKPMPRLERQTIADRIRPEYRQSLATLIDQVTNILSNVIAIMTEKDPADRFENMEEVEGWLRHAATLARQLAPYENLGTNGPEIEVEIDLTDCYLPADQVQDQLQVA